MRAGFRVDAHSITLDEHGRSRVQALAVGQWKHPRYGDIKIDADRSKRFADSVNNRVRGIDLDIDYDHKIRRDDAAGWVQSAESNDQGVWYLVEWTPEAADKIRNKQYRYFSAEYEDEWTDPATGTVYQDVMCGGALTNRPFIKGMVPVNLSEAEIEQAKSVENGDTNSGAAGGEGGDTMDKFLSDLASKLGITLSEGTSEEDARKAILAYDPPKPSGAPDDSELKRLAEDNPVIKKMLADQKAMADRLAIQETALRFSETESSIKKLTEGKSVALAPAVVTELTSVLVQVPKELSDKLVAAAGKLVDGTGIVKLTEPGGGTQPGSNGRSDEENAAKKFTEKIDEYRKNNEGASMRDATLAVAEANPELAEQYRQQSYQFRV